MLRIGKLLVYFTQPIALGESRLNFGTERLSSSNVFFQHSVLQLVYQRNECGFFSSASIISSRSSISRRRLPVNRPLRSASSAPSLSFSFVKLSIFALRVVSEALRSASIVSMLLNSFHPETSHDASNSSCLNTYRFTCAEASTVPSAFTRAV